MLKKQTVWLLTMLSLMIVLSVYYMNSPSDGELAFLGENNQNEETTGSIPDETSGDVDEVDNPSDDVGEYSSTEDDLFTMIRMQLEETRSLRREQLEDIFASSEASTDEKYQAYDEMQQIDNISSKELIVEETLKSENEYTDVLVRTKDDNIIVTVKADELSKTEANEIMQMVYDEFGTKEVEVKFQPNN
ncbi:stage III sporulation protein AH [Paraliobacillus quinghaiensis]|uniref:Stage III sporulation protein AH n=1 Tax=Paraliobacillus quinghaiensis TaxID=470815 RepID=A0A917TVS4_9BACI|nr:SpoIIIAH-like family protein [Paraliobacillus quinghaiensis]GGM40253.1 stage III sporulation protein AH [Paraliobacillus quinghaiensis]